MLRHCSRIKCKDKEGVDERKKDLGYERKRRQRISVRGKERNTKALRTVRSQAAKMSRVQCLWKASLQVQSRSRMCAIMPIIHCTIMLILRV